MENRIKVLQEVERRQKVKVLKRQESYQKYLTFRRSSIEEMKERRDKIVRERQVEEL